MPIDDSPCSRCGSYHCWGGCMQVKEFDMSLFGNECNCRTPVPGYLGRCDYCGKKLRFSFEPLPDLGVADSGLEEQLIGTMEAELAAKKASDATKEDLRSFLTAYMRDEAFAQRFADCIDLIRAKNADYSQGEDKKDRIAAFRRISRDIDVPMPKVWAIFAQKHWGAVMKYVKDGTVESEPIDGRINDLINYFVLLGAIVGDGK